MDAAERNERIIERGREFFRLIGEEQPSLFDRSRWTGAMLDWCMQNEAFKTQMFRFVDVFPCLTESDSLIRHIGEYFGEQQDLPRFLRTGARLAGRGGKIGASLLAKGIRGNIEEMARQFIVGQNIRQGLDRVTELRRQGFAFVLDVLGEATVSEEEAEGYVATYQELISALAKERRKWTPLEGAEDLDWDHAPAIQVSVKPSALYSQVRPQDFEGSVEGILARLHPIYGKIIEVGGQMCLDMESWQLKNITLEVFRRLRLLYPDYPHLGIALQSYLKESDRDLEDLLAWAREHRLPIAVRLVKGAYWDFETIRARQCGWEPPVYSNKAATDAAFERHARLLLRHHDLVHFACASHNIRSIAAVMEAAREFQVPEERYEFQVLYGMAEPVRKGLLKAAGQVRLYCPYGEMVPGMAYLVRRLLENTANESFLRQSFVEGAEIDSLLQDPARSLPPEEASTKPAGPDAPFCNEPVANFSRHQVRQSFTEALNTVRSQQGRTYPLHIGGKDIYIDRRLDSVNPANPQQVIGRVCQAGRKEADLAVAAAKDAWPAWRDTPQQARSEILLKAAQIARRRQFELAAWQVFEVGKQWDQAHGDVAEAIDFLEYYARQMLLLSDSRRLGQAPGEDNRYLYRPKGIAAVIAPWNFPLAISCGMTAAALAAGNCVVYKPSNLSPVVGHQLVELFGEAGLPPGVFNFLPGPGEAVGTRLVEHVDVNFIAFTGSKEVGLDIVERAATVRPGQTHVKKVIAEMGGKNAIIIDDDADLDEAIPQVLASAFAFQGQKCSACSRLIVVDAIFDRFAGRLVEAARSLKMGPAEDPANYLGPVVDAAARRKVLSYVDLAANEGEILYQSPVPERGYYVPLTLVAGIGPDARLAREEVFGPLLALMRVKDFEQALEWANATDFALTGGLFSRSPARMESARRRFRVGNLYLNRGITGALVDRQPFGGFGLSGIGSKAGGPDYLLQFLDPVTITENTLRRGFAPQEE